MNAWKKSHKKLCSQSDALLRLASLPRHKFESYFSFNKTHDIYLPAYKK
jgi:hypothetical protein